MNLYFAVRYDPTNGAIKAIVSGSDPNGVLLHGPEDAMLPVANDHPVLTNEARWRVDNGELVPKTQVTISANPNPFTANGTVECVITFTGMVADAICLVDRVPMPVLLSDPMLVITSDTPKKFTIEVLGLLHWSDSLTVEAV